VTLLVLLNPKQYRTSTNPPPPPGSLGGGWTTGTPRKGPQYSKFGASLRKRRQPMETLEVEVTEWTDEIKFKINRKKRWENEDEEILLLLLALEEN